MKCTQHNNIQCNRKYKSDNCIVTLTSSEIGSQILEREKLKQLTSIHAYWYIELSNCYNIIVLHYYIVTLLHSILQQLHPVTPCYSKVKSWKQKLGK